MSAAALNFLKVACACDVFEGEHDRIACALMYRRGYFELLAESEWLDYEYAHDLNYYYGWAK